ncbi:TVA4 protein, partial [Ibidorhyncha struthersii]|nr:TVA4 protein [Ibidorhyncha struthersii]
FPAAAAGGAKVQQETTVETTEGTGINITCSHPKIAADVTHWYRQFPDQPPQVLATGVRGTKPLRDPSGRLSVAADRR